MALTAEHVPELLRLADAATVPAVAHFLRAHAASLAPAAPAADSAQPTSASEGTSAPAAPVAAPVAAPAAAPSSTPAAAPSSAPARPAAAPVSDAPARSTSAQAITQYGWDQSAAAVKIYITLPGVEAGTVETSFGDKNVSVLVHTPGTCDRSFALTLAEKIVPSSCSYKTRSGRLVLTLAKAKPESWSCLTATEKKKSDKDMAKFDDKGDPNESIMQLMRKMYDDGDDEMKRTIAKAWSESRDKKGAAPF